MKTVKNYEMIFHIEYCKSVINTPELLKQWTELQIKNIRNDFPRYLENDKDGKIKINVIDCGILKSKYSNHLVFDDNIFLLTDEWFDKGYITYSQGKYHHLIELVDGEIDCVITIELNLTPNL